MATPILIPTFDMGLTTIFTSNSYIFPFLVKMGTVSIATINVRGLRDNLKRKQVLSFLKNSKHHIICLQETHEYAVDNKKWEKEWDGGSGRGWMRD